MDKMHWFVLTSGRFVLCFSSVFTSLLLHTMHELSVCLTIKIINTSTLNMIIYFGLWVPFAPLVRSCCKLVRIWPIN